MLHGERSHVFAAVSKRLLYNSVPPLVMSRSTFRSTFRLGEGKEKKLKKRKKKEKKNSSYRELGPPVIPFGSSNFFRALLAS